jgi:hypothetical protein
MRAAQLRQVAAHNAALLRTLSTAVPLPAKVTGIWCPLCRQWFKPSRFSRTSPWCKGCTTTAVATQVQRQRHTTAQARRQAPEGRS